jgi:hypothetical protein
VSQFTLDDIRAAAEKKYGNVDISFDGNTVTLLNPLRLDHAKRAALSALQDELNDSDGDQAELLRKGILLVAQNAEYGQRLIDTIGEDLTVLAQVFASYGEGVQAGEA